MKSKWTGMLAAWLLAGSAPAWGGVLAETPENTGEPLRVAVFQGAGAGDRGITAVGEIMEKLPDVVHEIVSAGQIREGVLDRFDMVMFTGGSGSRQAETLEPEGRERVKQHLREGGGYIGICAGAYLAGSGREVYLGLMPFQHHLPWQLGGGYVDLEISDTGKSILGHAEPAMVNVRYNNGPIFFDAEGNEPDWEAHGYEVLAHFRQAVRESSQVMVDMPAILSGKYEAGRFLIISPHPETIGDDHAHWIIESSLRHIGRKTSVSQ